MKKVRTHLEDRVLPSYTKGEEILNMVSHIAGGALAIAALVIGIMILTGHGSVFMKGGNTQARAQKYDEKKMEKVSGIGLILIGIATGIDAFTTSVTAKIVYVVVLFVILAVYLFVLRTKCLKK